jgi:hypothetical protein
MTNLGYESMTLKYMDEEGVRNVIVALTIAGEETEYIYDLMSEEVSKYMGWNVLTLPLTVTGQVEKVKVRFIGEGSITIQEIRFNMAERSGLDFSNSETTGTINTQKWDGGIISYNNALSAAAISAQYNEANHEVSTVRYYFDALLKYYNQGEGNMDITGKSKLIIVYNNLGDLNRLNVGLGTVDVTEDDSWKTAHMEIGNSAGFINNISIKSNMAKGEWATLEIDLTQYNTLKNGTDGKAINEIGIQQGYNESAGTITVLDETIYIRAIIVM